MLSESGGIFGDFVFKNYLLYMYVNNNISLIIFTYNISFINMNR